MIKAFVEEPIYTESVKNKHKQKNKGAKILLCSIKDYGLWQEISSPSRFRIQGGVAEAWQTNIQKNEFKNLGLIFDIFPLFSSSEIGAY